MTARWAWLIAALGVCGLVVMLALVGPWRQGAAQNPGGADGVGGPAPGAAAQHHYVLTDPVRTALAAQPPLWGPPLRATQLADRVVVATFFASWCIPCRAELQELRHVYARHRDAGLEIVAVNLFEEFDGLSDDARLGKFLARLDVPFPVVKGNPELAQTFGGVDRIPTLMVFDRHGRHVFTFRNTGPDNASFDAASLERLLEPLL